MERQVLPPQAATRSGPRQDVFARSWQGRDGAGTHHGLKRTESQVRCEFEQGYWSRTQEGGGDNAGSAFPGLPTERRAIPTRDGSEPCCWAGSAQDAPFGDPLPAPQTPLMSDGGRLTHTPHPLTLPLILVTLHITNQGQLRPNYSFSVVLAAVTHTAGKCEWNPNPPFGFPIVSHPIWPDAEKGRQ